MSDLNVRRWTGAFGVAAAVLAVVAFALYFAAGTPPKLEDTIKFSDYVAKNNGIFLTATLAIALSGVCFIVLVAGFRNLIRRARSEYEWASMLVFGVGLVDATLILVAGTLIGGAALDTVSKAEPAVVRALFEGGILIGGSVGLITDALLFASAGYAILGTGALPRWTGWASRPPSQPGRAGATLEFLAAPRPLLPWRGAAARVGQDPAAPDSHGGACDDHHDANDRDILPVLAEKVLGPLSEGVWIGAAEPRTAHWWRLPPCRAAWHTTAAARRSPSGRRGFAVTGSPAGAAAKDLACSSSVTSCASARSGRVGPGPGRYAVCL